MPVKNRKCIVTLLTDDGSPVRISVHAKQKREILGNVYLGRVESVHHELQGAFVRFGKDLTGFLSLDSRGNAYSMIKDDSAAVRAGDMIPVQVVREAMKTKPPGLSSDISLAGKYAVVNAKAGAVRYSSKLSPEEKSVLRAELKTVRTDGFALTVRTNAGIADPDDVRGEIEALGKELGSLREKCRLEKPYSCILEQLPDWAVMLRDLRGKNLKEIVTDIPAVCEEVKRCLPRCGSSLTEARLYSDPAFPLYRAYNLESLLERFTGKTVWLRSGGFLVIEQTEAFVSIDVNSGKNSLGKEKEDTIFRINTEAAAEAARQIRLRNLSGAILIDFINMSDPAHRDELMKSLREYLKDDPVRTTAVDLTALQIAEITRQKARKSLAEQLKEIGEAENLRD